MSESGIYVTVVPRGDKCLYSEAGTGNIKEESAKKYLSIQRPSEETPRFFI